MAKLKEWHLIPFTVDKPKEAEEWKKVEAAGTKMLAAIGVDNGGAEHGRKKY